MSNLGKRKLRLESDNDSSNNNSTSSRRNVKRRKTNSSSVSSVSNKSSSPRRLVYKPRHTNVESLSRSLTDRSYFSADSTPLTVAVTLPATPIPLGKRRRLLYGQENTVSTQDGAFDYETDYDEYYLTESDSDSSSGSESDESIEYVRTIKPDIIDLTSGSYTKPLIYCQEQHQKLVQYILQH